MKFTILGCGDIGHLIGYQLKQFGGTVYGMVSSQNKPRKDYIDEYFTQSELPQYLEKSDYVCNVLPSTPGTRNLLTPDLLKHCDDVVFINIGRGDVVEEDCILEALLKKRFRAAILDVFSTEPLPKESKLWTHPDVFITPHCAGVTQLRETVASFERQLKLFENGQPLEYVIAWDKGHNNIINRTIQDILQKNKKHMEEEHTAVHDEIILLEVIQDDSQLAENEEEIINFSEESLVKILNANIGHIKDNGNVQIQSEEVENIAAATVCQTQQADDESNCSLSNEHFKEQTDANIFYSGDQNNCNMGTQCDKGNATFYQFNQANKHAKHLSSHFEQLTNCNVCGIAFQNLNDLSKHLTFHVTEASHYCVHCSKGFNNVEVLKQHLTTSHAKKNTEQFQCNTCQKTFKRRTSLKKHKERTCKQKPMSQYSQTKQFDCTECRKRFKHACDLKRHLLVHTGEKPFKCEICTKTFKDSFCLQRHIIRHTGDGPYKCQKCGKGFSCNSELKRHVNTHDKVKCNYCNHLFQSTEALNKHIRVHTSDKSYKCGTCGKEFRQASYLNVHLRIHTGEKPYRCSFCNKDFAVSSSLTRHLLTHKREDDNVHSLCNECDEMQTLNQQPVINEVFNADTAGQEEGNVHVGKSEMINSLQSNFLDNVVSQIQKEDLQQQNFEKDNNISQVDENCVQKENCITENTEIQGFTENVKFQSPQILSNGNVPTVDLQTKETGLEQEAWKCSDCGQELKHSECFLRHLHMHEEKPFKCDICQRSFRTPADVKHHLVIHSLYNKSFRCSVCGDTFKLSKELKRHTMKHKSSDEKPFKCDICGKCFNEAGHFQRHMLIHSGEGPCKCTHCGKSFSCDSDLKRHMFIHSEQKPFQCQHCDRGFNQLSGLKRHEVSHTDNDIYKCNMCLKSFSHTTSLNIHMRSHTGEKPFACDICGKSFSIEGNMQRHQMIHTGVKPFQCSVCGKSFNVSSNLKTHLRIHSGEKAHRCDFCNKKFSDVRACKKHKCIHVSHTLEVS